MKFDKYGEVINSKETYEYIAKEILNASVIIGWTDENMTHFDILFTLGAHRYGKQRRRFLIY